MIENNPFTSDTFISYWSKHFLDKKKIYAFKFIQGLLFYKSRFLGLHINAGKSLTKGIQYRIDSEFIENIQGKTILIYDVMGFSGGNQFTKSKTVGFISIRQYPGFSIDFSNYDSLEGFMKHNFKKSSRYKLRKYKKRLEGCFDISFQAYHGEISKKQYDIVFDRFKLLLEKRFREKKIINNNLNHKEWGFYRDVAYPMILEKKVALFVLYNVKEPISITLAYTSGGRIFNAITVFDIDYAKFHLGSIKIMYLINWSIQNNWDILDFSKGHFDYKIRWSNQKYDFHYHIIYDKNSLYSLLIASVLKSFFGLKQYLREKQVNELLHRFAYIWKNKKSESYHYEFFDLMEDDLLGQKQELTLSDEENSFLKRMCFDFLYLFQEKEDNLHIYKTEQIDVYLLKGLRSSKTLKIIQ